MAQHQHFSMIRSFRLADFLTLANGFCGVGAVFQAMAFLMTGVRGHLYGAALLVPVAFVLDVLDGRVARWRHESSALGREMDSLADVISFGVAPACIAFAAGVNTALDQVILLYFVGCGLSRLARFNITADNLRGAAGKVAHFEGTPIPTSVVPLSLLMLAFHRDQLYPMRLVGQDFHLVAVVFLISGSLMISKTIRIPKF
jgi:CDP-diacylglycerol--serine O-phosphatidyltransferase